MRWQRKPYGPAHESSTTYPENADTVLARADDYPRYDDVIAEVNACTEGTGAAALAAGAGPVWVGPGVGFGKSVADNVELLRRLPELCGGTFPVLLGVSRKLFLGAVTGRGVDRRLAASLAVLGPAWSAGVDTVRVHDVPETVDTITLIEALGDR